MRIRKNAKISALLYTNTNLANDSDECMLHNNLCQLNQSPWDIITFPDSSSSFHQFDDTEVCYNVNLAGNGSSIDSIQGFESMASKTAGLGENDNFHGRDGDDEILGFKEEQETSEVQDEIKLCGKMDEKGWQCGNVVNYGNTMCDYHISELQRQAVWTTKKKHGPGPAGSRPNRPKKKPNSNPHEFYYYSGFGPSWGKKRGLTMGKTSNAHNKTTCVASNSNTCGVNGDINMVVQEETGMHYFHDDEDDEDDREIGKVGINGKKRVRKPIKERSLKSLM